MTQRPLQLKFSPWQIPILGFLGLILTGTILLVVLPTSTGRHLPLIDALFLSTSATCVTGLSVLNIGTDLSFWGQLILLIEIQLGGLGIMLISSAFLLALGRSLSIRSRIVVQDTYTHGSIGNIQSLVKHIVLFTLIFESIGTILIYVRIHDGMKPLQALYHAVFHAISAFCNAGFCLYADSFTRYRNDWIVNLTITGLIIFGGIGFLVLHELVSIGRRHWNDHRLWLQISLHSKIVVAMTSFLLLTGTLFFLLCEWSNTLDGLPLFDKLLASFFQSVTTRTAGFNTLNFSDMSNITLLGTLILMFIGASPGSTGGGIKTSTVGVFMALSRARLTGSEHAHIFRRTVNRGTIDRAFSIFVLAVVIIMIGTALLLLFEAGTSPYQESRGLFLEFLFEATSAFGTVGLSMGVTPHLTSWGKFTLVVLMYTGRLGPLVLATAFQLREQKARFIYAEERVMIG